MTVSFACAADRRVAVYLVTYRRPALLRRSIASVLRQTHRDLVLHVVNDDPDDAEVARIVAATGDARVRLFHPVQRRGAVRSFNLMFQETDATFSALLEDDNWWEPDYLRSQLAVLDAHPSAPLVVGNESIWQERDNGDWEELGQTIWPFRDVRQHQATLANLCGRARLANSAIVVRTATAARLLTPDTIPVDVTEHVRERYLPGLFPLNGAPLVNYARTRQTARSGGTLWGRWQIALIGSVFRALPDRAGRTALARTLWAEVRSWRAPRAATLIGTGLAMREARALLWTAPRPAVLRALGGYLRHPARLPQTLMTPRRMTEEIAQLTQTPLLAQLAGRSAVTVQPAWPGQRVSLRPGRSGRAATGLSESLNAGLNVGLPAGQGFDLTGTP